MKPLILTPDFYPGITCEQYFAEPCPAPALTNSGIKLLLNSCPARFAYEHPAINQPEEERKSSAAQRLGNLVHRLALDKGGDYAISPFDEYRSKEAKAWREETEAQGLIAVKQADFDRATAMATAIRQGILRETRDEPYQTEVVMAWQRTVGDFTFWCRGMIDVWCPSLGLALDVKTCADAGDKAISRAFATGYANQHDWYRGGIEAITGNHGRTRFGFLFVEKEAPYLYRYGEADEAFRWAAQQMNDRAAAIFARCLKAGEWPGYDDFTASPPAWWLNDLTTTEYQEAA